jgi:uncharacterized membrane protein
MNRKEARKKRKDAAQGNVWLGFSALTRVGICVVIGALCAYAVGVFLSWHYAPLVWWDVTTVTLLVSTWISIRTFTPEKTAEHASIEDPGRGFADVILILASIASLVAVAVLLVESAGTGSVEQILTIGVGVVSIVISWAVVHSVFMLRYADLYFNGNKIDFNTIDEEPTYVDFAYLAFTVGMTYQVADTNLTTRELRRTVLGHAFLSYVFGTAIIAATINFLAGLAK